MNKAKIKEKLNNLRKFDKKERSSFPYWFNHWKAYNLVAIELGRWKFKYLFHDIEKPFIRLFSKYETVQRIHRTNNRHHIEWLENKLETKSRKCGDGLGSYDVDLILNRFDFEGAIIDWECSRYTKLAKSKNAYDETNELFSNYTKFAERYPTICFYCYNALLDGLMKTLNNLGLNKAANSQEKHNETLEDAANRYQINVDRDWNKGWSKSVDPKYVEGVNDVIGTSIRDAFIAGSEWQKTQGEIHVTRIDKDENGWLKLQIYKDCTGFSSGDNVIIQMIRFGS